MEAATIKAIINTSVMVITLVSVWTDLTTWKKIGLSLLAVIFIFLSYQLDNKSDIDTGANKHYQDSINTVNGLLNTTIAMKADSIKLLQLSIKDTIKAAIDSSYQHSIKSSNEALAKYNFQLQDSLKTLKVNSNFGILKVAPYDDHPTVYNDSGQYGKLLAVQFVSGDGSVFNIALKYYVFDDNYSDSKNSRIRPAILYLKDSGNVNIAKDIYKGVITTSEIYCKAAEFNEPKRLIVIAGKYSKDYENKEQRNFIYAVDYDFVKGKLLDVADIPYQQFIQIFPQ